MPRPNNEFEVEIVAILAPSPLAGEGVNAEPKPGNTRIL